MDVNHSKIAKNSVLGRGLAARKDIHAGEVIVQISDPLLIVVERDAIDRVCSYCLIEHDAETLKRCGKCRTARYCSAKCQKLDWKLIHRNECSLLETLPGPPPTPGRALFQMRFRTPTYEFTIDPLSANLENHVEDLMNDKERWSDIALQAEAAEYAIQLEGGPPTKTEVVALLLCIITTNSFRVTLPDDTPIGLCHEPALALANHSCTPNAFVMFDGRRVSFMALNSIKKDEDIFISYVDFTQSREIRRAELRKRYFFDCNCEKCVNDDDSYETFLKTKIVPSPRLDFLVDHEALRTNAESRVVASKALRQDLKSLDPTIAKVYKTLEQKKSTKSEAERLRLLKQALSDLSFFKTNQLFAFPPYFTVVDELYLTYVDNGHLPSALVILLFLFLNCDIYNWPQLNHPVRITRLFAIARLLKYSASLEPTALQKDLNFVPKEILEGIDFIDAHHAIIVLVNELAPMSHGKEATFMGRVQEEMREVEEVQRLRGGTGEVLKKWQSGQESEKERTLVIKKIFDGLKALAGFGFAVVENQTI